MTPKGTHKIEARTYLKHDLETNMQRRNLLNALALVTLCAPSLALAQSYPERPVKLVVPYAPGGSADIVARMISEEWGKALGNNIAESPGRYQRKTTRCQRGLIELRRTHASLINLEQLPCFLWETQPGL